MEMDLIEGFRLGELIDPWGTPYCFAVDSNGDGTTEIFGYSCDYYGREVYTRKTIDQPYLIWSIGPNRRDELGEEDDICSWKPFPKPKWWEGRL